MIKGFTLLELIIVIIIVGILATVGLNQYTTIIERGRAGEARANLGAMRKLANEYYLKNGTLDTVALLDLGVGSSGPMSTGCNSASYYYYSRVGYEDHVNMYAYRCTANGKNPNFDSTYRIRLSYYPVSGSSNGGCQWTPDYTECPY